MMKRFWAACCMMALLSVSGVAVAAEDVIDLKTNFVKADAPVVDTIDGANFLMIKAEPQAAISEEVPSGRVKVGNFRNKLQCARRAAVTVCR